ncbi:MAG TPA: PilZ domain-containing protein [Candidatus Didemnitutus sp.]|nr:PilZ domain-containing protein [Candidatus Didemnitutus sp.]
MSTRSDVRFFQRILNTPELAGQKEHRRNKRFAVGQTFPVKAVITLAGRDGEGVKIRSDDAAGQDWGGWMVNLSGNGANLQLHPAAVADRGDVCTLRLSFAQSTLSIRARIAHFRPGTKFTSCGVSLEFPDADTQSAYLQVLEPVILGSSFKPVDSSRIKQDTPDLVKEQYGGDSGTRLTVWRAPSEAAIAGFELLLGSHSITGTPESLELDIQPIDGADATAAAREEVIRLFKWITPNLPKSVPSDVRKFLARY